MKEAYYFPHYSVARNDRKVKRLRKQLGVEGYGIYFMLLEILREQTDFRYPFEDLDLLSDDIGTSEEKVRVVILNYNLFEVDQEYFFSPKLIEYLQPYLQKSQRARNAALKRWRGKSDANALPEHSKCNANQNASRTKENKESKGEEGEYNARAREQTPTDQNPVDQNALTPKTIPDKDQWMSYCTMHSFHPEYAEHVYNQMESVGWLDMVGRPIRNWQVYAQNKFKYQAEFLQGLKPKDSNKSKSTNTETYADKNARISRQTDQAILRGEISI